MEQPEWLHPYTRVDGELPWEEKPSRVVRDLLRDRALGQASGVIAAIDHWNLRDQGPDKLPEFLVAVGRETAGYVPKRVANMLRAFRRALETLSKQPADFPALRVLDPMLAQCTERGRDVWFLTSPALLTIQAILYSHDQWLRPEHHEAHSALSAYDRLGHLDPPIAERDRCFVAALIAHQTILRVAWQEHNDENHPREVAAFDGRSLTANYVAGRPAKDDEKIARGIARTLFPYVERFEKEDPNGAGRLRPWLASALALTSFCLQHRHHPATEEWSPRIEKQAHRFAKLIAAADPQQSSPPCTLVFWQYGRRVMQHQGREGWDQFRAMVVQDAVWQRTQHGQPESLTNLTYCFDRNASRKPWEPWPPQSDKRPALFHLDTGAAGREENLDRQALGENIESTIGLSVTISPKESSLVLRAVGLSEDDLDHRSIESWLAGDTAFLETFWLVQEALEKKHLKYVRELERVEGDELPRMHDAFEIGYFPVPLVGHVLRELHRVRPGSFSLLKLRPRDLPTEVKAPFVDNPLIIFLPRQHEDIASAGAENGRRAKWLIARYVAAMVNNLLVTLAPRRVEIDFFSEEVRESWKEWIDQAMRENGRDPILDYLMQYRSELCRVEVTEALEGVLADARVFPQGCIRPASYLLGIDIGATGIKCGRAEVTEVPEPASPGNIRLGLEVSPRGGEVLEFPTDTSKRYSGAAGLADRVFKLIKAKRPEWLRDGVVAIGIAWPGAVRDSAVKANSGILGKFEGFNERGPNDLRKLKLAEAFAAAYQKAREPQKERQSRPIVTLLNDGDADIKATEHLVGGERSTAQGVSVILKAGTGTACGIYVDGRQVELLAEVGKVVVNLGSLRKIPSTMPSEKLAEKGFPEGLLNRHFSKKTLPAIAEAFGWRVPANTPPMDSREIGYFISDCPPGMKLRIAQELIFQRFMGLVDSPEDVKNGIEPVDLYFPSKKRLQDVADVRIDQLRKAAQATGRSAEKVALRCARIAGRQLADAIALLGDLFHCREIRLGGGPLTGRTGVKVAQQAVKSLRDVYAFAVEPVSGPTASRGPRPAAAPPHPLSEDRWIRVHYPSDAGRGGIPMGVLGAARAALDAYVRETKRRALAAERTRIEEAAPGSVFAGTAPGEKILLWEDVVRLIEAFMSSLRLRMRGDKSFEKISPDL